MTTPTVKLLCLDDDEHSLQALRRVLRNEAWSSDFFSSPHEAIKALDQQHYDVIISDYRMPAINGIQFLEYAKLRAPLAQRIILSAGFDASALTAAVNRAEVYRVITKPWDNQDLLLTVQRAVAKAQSAVMANPPRGSDELLQVEFDRDGSIVLDDNGDNE